MKILLNLFLLLLAWMLLRLLIIIFFVYAVIKLLIKCDFSGLEKYLFDCALTLDMSGNVIGQHMLNDLWVKPHGYRFGEFGVTISKVLAKNKAGNTWYEFGAIFGKLLNWLDKDHLGKSKL